MATLAPSSNLAAVVSLNRRNTGRFVHTICQEDLDRALLKRSIAREAAKDSEAEDEWIAEALRAGAQIQPGLHAAHIVKISRKASRVRACTFHRLIIT